METLTIRQMALDYIHLFGEDEAFFKVEEIIKGMGNDIRYKHLLEVLEEIKGILNLDSCGDKIK